MNRKKQTTLYANLMGEVKVRFQCINRATSGAMALPTPIVREFCYLQLRFLCELIALSCLVAHGDIKAVQSHKIGRTYKAGEMLDHLTTLRPHFYPIAFEQQGESKPIGINKYHSIKAVEPSPFAREELLKFYGKCHKYLHRGSLKNLLSLNTPIDMKLNTPEIIGIAQKMSNLLSRHVIKISKDFIFICILNNKDDGEKVQVVTAESTIMLK